MDATRTPVYHQESETRTTQTAPESGTRPAVPEPGSGSPSAEVVVEDSRFASSPARRPRSGPRSARRARVRTVSVVIPAFNEAGIIHETVGRVTRAVADHRDVRYEVIVVDDGSRDQTADAARQAGARVISHPYNIGNGAAVKTGIRQARGDYVVCLDGDGQHRPEYIPIMVDRLDRYHMVVGARDRSGQASLGRAVANWTYNRFAAYITSFPIVDLTSGFRAMRTDVVRRFLYLLPNTFSYPTTITLSLLRAGFSVHYLPMVTDPRQGRSKINPWEDGARFFMILIKIATLFAPLRIFLPLAAVIFSAGLGYYLYTFFTVHRFTNMGVLLMVLSFLMFSLGLISEQIAQLRFDRSED